MKSKWTGPGNGPMTVNYSILREDVDMPGFNGMGPWGRGLRRGRSWRDCHWGGEYEFPGYGPAMWWDIPAARSYATQREELADLRCRAQMLTQELETVRKRIVELAEAVNRTLDG
jgi:hypothetical protein